MFEDEYGDFSLKKFLIVVGLITGFFVIVFIAGSIFETNGSNTYQVKQAAFTGELSVRDEPGMYMQNFATITTYIRAGQIDFEEVTTMSDGAKVTFPGSVKFRLPSDEKTRLKLHKDFGSYNNVVENLIKKNTIDVLSNKTAPMFTASDTYSARKPEIARILEGQLQNGAYDVYYEDVKMPDGTKYRLARVRMDENGNPKIIGKNLLNEYGIEILQVVMGDPRPEEKILKIIDAQKEAEQKAVLARSQAEKARQDTITITEQGKADVAKAEAEANRLKVSAGLTPQEKAEWEYKTKVGIAQAVASVKFPASMIVAGGSNGGSANPFDAIGLQSLYNLSNQMAQ